MAGIAIIDLLQQAANAPDSNPHTVQVLRPVIARQTITNESHFGANVLK
jgi:hypothetical protein